MTTNFISKADNLFKETLNDILANGVSTEGHKVRPKYKDGTLHIQYI
jgi:thymidylate synthase